MLWCEWFEPVWESVNVLQVLQLFVMFWVPVCGKRRLSVLKITF